ncbi:MAG: hypothetical protein L0228_03715 [Planctomycetes bacterium]|nr:hypothetical protein [Planctomycetota bacterium]
MRGSLCRIAVVVLAIAVSRLVWAEIPAGPDVPTNRSYLEKQTQFLTRVILEPYQMKRAASDAATADNDPAEQFLRLWIEGFARGYEEPKVEPMLPLAKQAIDAGCDDPMFAYCYGRVLQYQGKAEESAKYLKVALDNLESEGYEVPYCAAAARHLGAMLTELNRREEAVELVDRELEYLARTVADGPYLPDEQRQMYNQLSPALEKYSIEKLQPLVERINTHLYPWLWQMASARLETRLAWKARGGGWANEVTEEGWKGFERHMAAARDHLSEAWNLNPEWPESAASMIGVAMAGHAAPEETPRFWFDRAVTAELDHIPAYNALLWSLMPRWGGSHQQLYALGRECLDTGRFDTHVPFVYIQAFDHIVKDIGSTFDYYKTPGVYEDLQTLADGYLGEPSMAGHDDWYRAFKVAAAVRCERWEDARQFLESVKGEPDETAFARFGLKSADVLGEIYARSGELAGGTAEAEQLAAAGKFDEAKAKYEDLTLKAGDRRQVTTYFRGRLRGLEFDDQFGKGEWTALPLDEQLSGWRNLGGKWSVDNDGRLIAEPQENGLRLVHDKQLGPRFELRGKVAFVKRPYGKANIGVYFGQPNGRMSNSLRLFFDGDYAALLRREETVAQNPVNVEDANTFHIERWDNTISAYVNDKRVADAIEIEADGPLETEVVALGGNYWYDGPMLRYEGLEVRKLEKPPEGMVAKVEAEKDSEAGDGEKVDEAEGADEAEP